MGYISVKNRTLISQMKQNFTLPREWNRFLYEVGKNHQLIIKNGKTNYYCTNCSKSFISTAPIGKIIKCPCCKNKYEVRSNKLKHYKFKDNVCMIDNIENEIVIRIFEMRSEYNGDKQQFEHSTVEYARKILEYDDNYIELRNERVSIAQCGPHVLHWKDEEGNWRAYDGYYYSSYGAGFFFTNNLKKVLKGTQFEHSRIWEYARHGEKIQYNIESILSAAKYESFEFLVELKLYNLASYSRRFLSKGSFKNIFGVDKTYYDFMRKNNITCTELEMLKVYPTRNIKELRNLSTTDTWTLNRIQEFVKLKDLIPYFINNNLNDYNLYLDYLRFAQKLGIDLKNKKYAFPENLKAKHDEYEKQIELLEEEKNNNLIMERAKQLMKNTFKYKKFVIFPAKCCNDLIDESSQQNNCVRTYIEKYARGECDIYFMRLNRNKKKSLVTIEVRKNEVVQKRIKNNEKTTEEQDEAIEQWEEIMLKPQTSEVNQRILEYAAV